MARHGCVEKVDGALHGVALLVQLGVERWWAAAFDPFITGVPRDAPRRIRQSPQRDQYPRPGLVQLAPLAETYRQFLELVGRSDGLFMRGGDVFYPSVLGLGQAVWELLAANTVPAALTDDDRAI